jgi:acyl carrier protein
VLPEAGSPAEVLGSHIIVAHVSKQRELLEKPAEFAPAPASGRENADVLGGVAVDPAAVASLRRELNEVAPNERADVLVNYVRSNVNRVQRRNSDKSLDRRQRLMDLGVDSLMAVELRNVLTVGLGLDEPLPATLIYDYPTIEEVALFLDAQLAVDGELVVADETQTRGESRPLSTSDVDRLSDDEVKAALLAKIGGE